MKLILWDMDGTLIQSAHVVPDAFRHTAEQFGHPGYSRQDIIDLYPLGVPENVFAHIFGVDRPAGQVNAQVNTQVNAEGRTDVMTYFYNQLAENSHRIKVYEGIVNCLTALRNHVKLAVFTGASQRSADILLSALKLDDYFDLILGGDDYPAKPDPAGLVAVANRLNVPPEQTVYVGDAHTDIEAARAAGMLPVAAGWGHLYQADNGYEHIALTPLDVLPLASQ